MIRKILASILASLFVLGSLVTISGCNTVEGVGKDISAGGNEIKEEARENKKY